MSKTGLLLSSTKCRRWNSKEYTMPNVAILQSGFLSLLNDHIILPVETQTDISQIIIKPYKHTHTAHYYAKSLYDIIVEFNTQNNIVRSFEYRDRFLKELLAVMDIVSFKKWVYMQVESTMLNNLNVMFLLDTLNYIAGDTRKYDAASWVTLVEANHATVDKDKLKLTLECYFGDYRDQYLYDGCVLPPGLSDIIAMWTSRVGGFKDMISSFDVIFGNKSKTLITGSNQLAGSSVDFAPGVTFNARS